MLALIGVVYDLLHVFLFIHILNTTVTNGFDKKLDKKITNFRRLKHIKEITLSTLDKDVTYKKFTHLP